MKLSKVYKEILQEAKSVDIRYIQKEIEKFNDGEINMDKLISSVFWHSDVKTNPSQRNKILDALEDHISNSTEDDEVPTDIAEELYNICHEMA